MRPRSSPTLFYCRCQKAAAPNSAPPYLGITNPSRAPPRRPWPRTSSRRTAQIRRLQIDILLIGFCSKGLRLDVSEQRSSEDLRAASGNAVEISRCRAAGRRGLVTLSAPQPRKRRTDVSSLWRVWRIFGFGACIATRRGVAARQPHGSGVLVRARVISNI